tara:strand:- start:3 stop:1118 length:1116 start_codon:yes stop_codon:yes gene_type:complete
MAFNMNRPIIKGTANHKASVAKATQQSIVSQARTTADASLVGAGKSLGESYIPAAMDYTVNQKGIEFADVKKEGGEGKSSKPKKEKEPKAKRKSYWEKMREKRSLQKTKAAEERLRKRLEKAEQGEDAGDFSQIESEPSRETKKTEKYTSPEASTKEGEELLSRTKAGRNKALQDAAKKYNVKVEDLEAKEIGGKREFFPKQDVVGGKEETRWDNELGRFRNPEITAAVGEEAEKAAVEEMKPKFPEGMDPNLATTGEIALNYDTNTYEYTQQYYDRLAKEKIKPTSTTTKPVVEEKKTTTPDRKPRPSDFEGTWKQRQEQYKIANEKWYQAQQEKKGKSPATMRDNRIYRNAVKGGAVQRNMIKSGYKPE